MKNSIRYENIAILHSDLGAHSVENNSGQNLSFLPLVQGLNFSFDVETNNVAELGNNRFINTSYVNAPDVNLSIDTLEGISPFLDTLFNDTSKDLNLYALISKNQHEDASQEALQDFECLSFGNAFVNNISINQSVGGLMSSQYSFVCSNVEAQKLEGMPDAVVAEGAGTPSVNSVYINSGGSYIGSSGYFLSFFEMQWFLFTSGIETVYVNPLPPSPPADWGVTLPLTGWQNTDPVMGSNPIGQNPAPILRPAKWEDIDEAGIDRATVSTLINSSSDLPIPSLNLTGNQQQGLTGYIEPIESYYTSTGEGFVPFYKTYVTIVGRNNSGTFLLDANAIQNMDLNIPVDRKSIYSVNKIHPIKRKVLQPTAGTFSFSNVSSLMVTSGDDSNLKEYIKNGEVYNLAISGESNLGQRYSITIPNTRLTSFQFANSLGSNSTNDMAFEFDVEDILIQATSSNPFAVSYEEIDLRFDGIEILYTD